MNFEELISTYGYAALFLGTFLEGETILVVAGILAEAGHLNLALVILTAFAGSLFGDQLYFFIGRYHGNKLLPKHPRWEKKINKAKAMLDKYSTFFILIFRFIYGVRTFAPFAIGMSNVKTYKFIILNIISAIIWAIVLGTGGYLFGNAIEIFMGDMKKYVIIIAGVILVLAIIHFIYTKIKNNK